MPSEERRIEATTSGAPDSGRRQPQDGPLVGNSMTVELHRRNIAAVNGSKAAQGVPAARSVATANAEHQFASLRTRGRRNYQLSGYA